MVQSDEKCVPSFLWAESWNKHLNTNFDDNNGEWFRGSSGEFQSSGECCQGAEAYVRESVEHEEQNS